MALPFLSDKKSIADVIAADRRPDGQNEEEADPSSNENADLMAVAHELIAAIHAKDAHAVASALQAAQGLCDLDK